jgi:uncharacterized protein HemY
MFHVNPRFASQVTPAAVNQQAIKSLLDAVERKTGSRPVETIWDEVPQAIRDEYLQCAVMSLSMQAFSSAKQSQ